MKQGFGSTSFGPKRPSRLLLLVACHLFPSEFGFISVLSLPDVCCGLVLPLGLSLALPRVSRFSSRKAESDEQPPSQPQPVRRRRRRFSNGNEDDYDEDEVFTSGEEGDGAGDVGVSDVPTRRDSLLSLRDGVSSGRAGGSGSLYGPRKTGGGGSSREGSEHGTSGSREIRADDGRPGRRRNTSGDSVEAGGGGGGRRRVRSGSRDGRSGSRKTARREGSSNARVGGGGEDESERRGQDRSNRKQQPPPQQDQPPGGKAREVWDTKVLAIERPRRSGRGALSASPSGSAGLSNSHCDPRSTAGSGGSAAVPDDDGSDVSSSFAPLGVPAASVVAGSMTAEMALRGLGVSSGGWWGGKRARGAPAVAPSTFGDASAEDMVELVQVRDGRGSMCGPVLC